MSFSQLATAGLESVGRSAVASFGWQLGRRIEGNFVRFVTNGILLVAGAFVGLGGFFLPFMAARRIMRWHPIGWARYFFRVFLNWTILGAVGIALLYGLMFFLGLLVLDAQKRPPEEAYEIAKIMTWLFGTGGILVGAVVGLSERRRRKRAYAVVVENQRFLDTHGIRELDGESVTHVDGGGNRLRLEHTGRDIIEFKAVGPRRKRAFITVGQDGRFLDYSGLVDA